MCCILPKKAQQHILPDVLNNIGQNLLLKLVISFLVQEI